MNSSIIKERMGGGENEATVSSFVFRLPGSSEGVAREKGQRRQPASRCGTHTARALTTSRQMPEKIERGGFARTFGASSRILPSR